MRGRRDMDCNGVYRSGKIRAPGAAMVDALEPRRLMSAAALQSNLPPLESDPAASDWIFLDFAGAAPKTWDGINVPATPAYDSDGDPATFSSMEVGRVREIWSRVAEKFSPF